MQITLTSKRQATFPAEVCEAMGVQRGSRLELLPGDKPDEWLIRPFRVRKELLAPLKNKIASGIPGFHLAEWREKPRDHAALRD